MISRALVISLVVASVGACRSGEADGGERRNGIVGALHDAVTPAPPVELAVRFNPAACDCPAFEVLLDGRWSRAFIEGEATALAPAEALKTADPLAVARVLARVEGRPRLSDNGVRYPVVVVD